MGEPKFTPMRVVAAAIRLGNGIFSMPTPARHNDLIRALAEAGQPTPIKGEQGFITSGGTFASRNEAAFLAFEAQQIKRPTAILYTEDLW